MKNSINGWIFLDKPIGVSSNKALQKVRKIADNEPYKIPATIDDPVILDEIKKDLKDNNILKT